MLTKDELCITNRNNFYLTEHLTNDNTNVFIIDIYTLSTVYALDFIHQVILQSVFTKDCKNILWVWRSSTKLFTSNYLITITNNHSFCHWNKVFKCLTEFILNDNNTFTLTNIFEFNSSRNLCKYTRILWFTSFKQFRYTRKATSNIVCFLSSFWQLSNCSTSFDCSLIFYQKKSACRQVVVTLWVTSFISDDYTRLFNIQV